MKINMSEELTGETLLSHIVLHGLTQALKEQFSERMNPFQTNDGVVMDVTITADGVDLDLNEFCEHWQKQVSRMIKERAEVVISDKFVDINNLLYDLGERLKPEIEERLEDWEKQN